jgi:hypothetical protein
MIGARAIPSRAASRLQPPAHRRVGGWVALLVASMGLSACYTYAPLRDPEPQLGQSLSFELDEPCPEGLADAVGPDTKRVEGTLVRRTETDFVVSVDRAITHRGQMYRWSGETVSLPQDHVRQVRSRRFSPTRTFAVAGGAVVSFFAFVITRSLTASGGVDEKTGEPKQDDGNVQ